MKLLVMQLSPPSYFGKIKVAFDIALRSRKLRLTTIGDPPR
jgi:hypothetical protein